MSDRHTEQAERLASGNPALCLTPLHSAEWTHAVEQHVFRGSVSDDYARKLHKQFARDCTQSWTLHTIPDSAFERCIDLALLHVSEIGLRTLDTLHVAVALELKISVFWTFDERQMKLAKAVGLRTN